MSGRVTRSDAVGRPMEILLVEDSLADARLTIEALREGNVKHRMTLIRDGLEARRFLNREGIFAHAPRPDLILLDLDLPELSGRDLLAETRHFWLERPDGAVISTLRLMEEHAGGEKTFRIGRVRTRRSERGQGHTARLMAAALADVGDHLCRINAQTYLAEMYARHGFVVDGDEFVEDGIPHVPMVRRTTLESGQQ